MIYTQFPAGALVAADAVSGARTIAGTAVPWNTPGRVSTGELVVFHPGALDPAARPVALRDHDRTRPIGRVVDAADTGDGLTATVRVAPTRDGDEALVLAAPPDNVLGMFSVGAEPTAWSYDDDGTMHVTAADWIELSLLPLGAFTDARITRVTATQPGEPPMTITDLTAATPFDTDDPDTIPADVPPDDDDDDGDDPPVVETRAPALPVTATAGRGRVPASLTLRTLGPVIQAARAGNRAARQHVIAELSRCTVEAALTDVTMVGTNNVGSMYRPAYQPEIVEIVNHGSPIVNTIRQGDLTNGDFPNKTFVKWDLTPQVALQTAEKTDINSSPAKLSVVSVPVQTWATGNDISRQTLDLGPPSFVEEWVRAASVDYAATIETYAVTALMTAATAVTTLAGDTFLQVIGKLYGALSPVNVPSGRLFLAVSHDVSASMIGIKQSDGPAFWGGNMSLSTFTTDSDVGGLEVIVSTNLPSKTYLMGLTTAATWYDAPGVPYTLQAVNVGKLGLDIGIYGYGALGVQYPAALVKTTQP